MMRSVSREDSVSVPLRLDSSPILFKTFGSNTPIRRTAMLGAVLLILDIGRRLGFSTSNVLFVSPRFNTY
jgi:hypothetical protein